MTIEDRCEHAEKYAGILFYCTTKNKCEFKFSFGQEGEYCRKELDRWSNAKHKSQANSSYENK